jgi:autotransporter adhesin
MIKGGLLAAGVAAAALSACGLGGTGVDGARVAVVGHTAYAYPSGMVAVGAVDADGNPITHIVVVNWYCGPLINPDYSKLAEDDHCARWRDDVEKDWVIGPGSSFSAAAGDTGLDYLEGA